MKRRHIGPGEKILLAFTARERVLVIDHTFAGPELTEPLDAMRLVRGNGTVRYSLDDLDDLLGYVAAEANHVKSKSLRNELDALFARLQDEMVSYDDEPTGPTTPPKPVVSKPTQLSVLKGEKKR